MFKEQDKDKYPDIILSDCFIKSIEVSGDDIVVIFSERGFFKNVPEKNNYYRTDGAKIVIEKCDFESITIQEFKRKLFSTSVIDIEGKDFFRNINSGEWRFEIVEEFYAIGKALYIGRITENNMHFWCHIKIRFDNLVYLWNNIRYDWPF